MTLHIGADAAVPQQIDRRTQNRAHQLLRRDAIVFDCQRDTRFFRQFYLLGLSRPDTATIREQATVVVIPRRTRQTKQSLAFGERSEEHTSELQSLMRIPYYVFCLKKKK